MAAEEEQLNISRVSRVGRRVTETERWQGELRLGRSKGCEWSCSWRVPESCEVFRVEDLRHLRSAVTLTAFKG